ncbi:AP2 domain-containing protein [Paracidovorax citrulli]|nr:AP2 domain-containing protein [Paracidovorax citrulli]MVT28899.1 AP2 domain-containing protein [Paracidovorax citrulli]PVY62896.1 AP2 domain-containing protein [Paracidovorax citrulli]REG68120.1 AP2 domain-containing protein [Paracidovorax citrulli]RLJ92680.1 AP2 domain-containing protein [Paracidovorax citrulli]UMT83254.1 AP2 domain-containing protein [Paracidovorax citrulli]
MVVPKPPKIYGLIPRYESGKLLRWSVSITRRGKHFDKEFRVATYGDPEKAKAAAIAYRDELLKKVPAMSRREFGTIVRSNNTSGIPGVSRREENGYARWSALVSLPDGTTRRRTFAVVKYGEEVARQKAIEARSELLKLLDGWFVHHPDAVPLGQTPSAVVPIVMPKRERSLAKGKRQPSPEKRVYRMEIKWSLRSGVQVCRDYWVAECAVPTGGTRRRQFSVAEYGEDGARRLAFEQRREWLEHPPELSRKRAQRKNTHSM